MSAEPVPSTPPLGFSFIPADQPLPEECKGHRFTRVTRDPTGKILKIEHPEACEMGTAKKTDICNGAVYEALAAREIPKHNGSNPEENEVKPQPESNSQAAENDLKLRHARAVLRMERGRFEEYTPTELIDMLGLLQGQYTTYATWKKAMGYDG